MRITFAFTTIIRYYVSGFGKEIWHLTDKKITGKGKDTKGKKTQRPKALPSVEVPAGYSSKNRQKRLKKIKESRAVDDGKNAFFVSSPRPQPPYDTKGPPAEDWWPT